MIRIGLAASKIVKGNIWTYHLAVVLISFLFAMFIFLVCGFIIASVIFVLSFVLEQVLPSMDHQVWLRVLRMCLKLLGILTGIWMIVAIVKNSKLKI